MKRANITGGEQERTRTEIKLSKQASIAKVQRNLDNIYKKLGVSSDLRSKYVSFVRYWNNLPQLNTYFLSQALAFILDNEKELRSEEDLTDAFIINSRFNEKRKIYPKAELDYLKKRTKFDNQLNDSEIIAELFRYSRAVFISLKGE